MIRGWLGKIRLSRSPAQVKREDSRAVSGIAVANEYISFYPSCRECACARRGGKDRA